jgi:hypothetical protein
VIRHFASVTPPPGEPRVRHYKGLPWASDRAEFPLPSVAVLNETPDGFFLIRLTSDGTFCGDTWHLTADDARAQAEFEFDRVGDLARDPGRRGRSSGLCGRPRKDRVTFALWVNVDVLRWA